MGIKRVEEMRSVVPRVLPAEEGRAVLESRLIRACLLTGLRDWDTFLALYINCKTVR